jgi:hypothetical protein
MGKNGSLGLVLLAFLVSAGALAGCGEEPVPLNPSYSVDIKPLMGARCIRCHGAGGTLNVDPDSLLKGKTVPKAPNLADFTKLEDTPGGPKGLLSFTSAVPGGDATMMLFVRTGPMPPPPAPHLTEREFEMLERWVKNPILQ